jgi:hypothetical protein
MRFWKSLSTGLMILVTLFTELHPAKKFPVMGPICILPNKVGEDPFLFQRLRLPLLQFPFQIMTVPFMFYFICGIIFVNSLRAGTLCICDALDIVAAGRFYGVFDPVERSC